MIILGLKLFNIRSYRNAKINFDEKISVFSGRTGSGKSTVLVAIEYALFGNMINLSNSSILRRGASHGWVELSFKQRGHEYTITRGLKRKGVSIGVDEKNMSITKNGETIPLLARATDLTQKILQILGFPEKSNPVELFQVTSYTRQDEIKKIISMRPEERQQYIDRTLQISKYQLAYDNLKDVINYFEKKKENLKGGLKLVEGVKEELSAQVEELENLRRTVEQTEKELKKVVEDHEKIYSELKEHENHEKSFQEQKQEFDRALGRVQNLKTSITGMQEELSTIKKKLGKQETLPANSHDLESEKTAIETQVSMLSSQSKEVFTRLEELGSRILGKKTCPLCKQELDENLLSGIKTGYEQKIEQINKKIVQLKKQRLELEESLGKARKAEEESREMEANKVWVKKTEERLSTSMKECEELEKRKIVLETELKDHDKLEKMVKALRAEEKEFYSKKESLSQKRGILSSNIHSMNEKVEGKKRLLAEFEITEKKVRKLEEIMKTLNNLRESIRNIREVVRNKFLEDFRYEFQKKFEEIRRSEGEYSVDIKNDYEPIAFADNEETRIESLSGGEKTSVALSYRLALSEIAARASELHRTELLLLDEPTTGFDSDDIKSLPQILRNIQSIPQMIIVTHEPELKNAADTVFEVTKKKGVSEITF